MCVVGVRNRQAKEIWDGNVLIFPRMEGEIKFLQKILDEE